MGILQVQDKNNRYAKLQAFMSEQGIDALVGCGEGAVKYLGGEFINTRWTMVCAFRDSEPVAFVAGPGREYLLTAIHKNMEDYWIKDFRINSPRAISQLIIERAGASAKVGMTQADFPAGFYFAIRAALPEASLVDITGSFQKIRRCKTGNEIELLRRSTRCVDACCRGLQNFLKPGLTEIEIWGFLEGIMRSYGSPDTLNQTCVDKRDISSVMPCWCHTQRPLERGDLIAAEITSSAGGYWTQKIMTISLGRPEPIVKDMNVAGQQAIKRAAAAVKPGIRAHELVTLMDQTIEAAGFLSPRQFLTGPQGHLSGLEVDEGLPFDMDGEFVLEEGMLFVLHPGVAVRGWTPGDYGIFGPGTMFLVTRDGAESLNEFPNDIMVI
jgi:Xaa-Pro aminopeptidase